MPHAKASSNSMKLGAEEIGTLFDNPDGNKWSPVLTTEEAAELLHVSKSTLYEWHRLGRLKGCCRKRGKHLRFLRNRLIQTFFDGEDWR